MPEIHRRGFLTRAATLGAGVAGLLYPDVANLPSAHAKLTRKVTSPAVEPPLDPTYAGGTVASIGNAGSYVLESAGSTRVVTIPSSAIVWKEIEGPPSVISLGDWLDVKGTPQADGSLLATSGMIFANIARLDGHLIAVTPDVMTVSAYGETLQCELSSALEVVSARDQSPYPGGLAAIAAGTEIGAVGIKLSNGTFRATRVWA